MLMGKKKLKCDAYPTLFSFIKPKTHRKTRESTSLTVPSLSIAEPLSEPTPLMSIENLYQRLPIFNVKNTGVRQEVSKDDNAIFGCQEEIAENETRI